MMVTQKRLKELLSYDPATGIFRWIATRQGCRAPVGSVAGTPASNRYLMITIDRIRRGAHQWAFLYVTGKWPKSQMDHRNGDRSDNRWKNLRAATGSQNHCNSSARHGGLKGTTKHRNSWMAQITVKKRRIYLGCFPTREEAHAAYWSAAQQHHGEFARKA